MSSSLVGPLIDRPRYIPSGFVLWQVTDGSEWGGFNDLSDQLRLGYARQDGEFGPLQVVIAAVSRLPVLFGTEEQPGIPIPIGVPGATAVYHDGMWSPGAGPGRVVQTPSTPLHWDTSICHSVVAMFSRTACAVRAWRLSGLDIGELSRIAASLAPTSDPAN